MFIRKNTEEREAGAMKRDKTEYGYINYRKKRQFLMTLFMVLIGVFIYLLGLLLNKWESANIFTVAAILMVLPGAKYLVNFIVFAPYHTPERESYEKLKSLVKDRGRLYSDLVITSPEKVMNLDFLWLEEGCVLGVIGKNPEKLSYVQQYLSGGIRNWAPDYRVKILRNQKELFQELSEQMKRKEKEKTGDFEKAEAYLKSLIV